MEEFHQHAVWRQLPPTRLAKAAARRAYRRARQALYRHLPPLTQEQLLRSFGVVDAATLATETLKGRTGKSWCEVSRRDSVRTLLSHMPAAQERARARAVAALNRSFNVFGTKMTFGADGRTDWSLDVGSNWAYPNQPAAQIRLLEPGWDPKYAWVFGRLDHLLALGQGYWIGEGDPRRRFAQAFVEELSDFIAKNPVGYGVHWTCPMEVALRAANMAQALAMFSDAREVRQPEFVLRAMTALAEHTSFVEANLEDGSAVPNNHLVANHVGLWVVGLLFPQLPHSRRQLGLARSGLIHEMKRQVHSDGASFEGSIPYHRLSLELFAMAQLFAQAHGEDLGHEYRDRLRRMFLFARTYCSHKGLAPQLGDNDSGRAFALCDRTSLDHGYLAPLGASLFGDPELKGSDDTFPDEAAWLLGQEGFLRFGRLSASANPASRISTDGGFAILRGEDVTVTASVGGNGQGGVGGHSHRDKLSFEMHIRGEPVIVDPGTATYSRNPAKRNVFRSTGAHNCPKLDGREQSPLDPSKLFALPEAVAAEVIAFERTLSWQRLTARHRGYQRLPQPAEICRTWLLDSARCALGVVDAVESTGRHSTSVRLQFRDGEARMRRASAGQRARASAVFPAPRDFAPDAVELGPVQAPTALILFDANFEWALSASAYSPGYGELLPALALTLRRKIDAPAQLGWAVLWGNGIGER